MSVNLLTGLPPTNFGTDYQTWFYNGLFGNGISIFPNYNTPSIFSLNSTLNASFSASAGIYLATINDKAGFAFDISSQNSTEIYTVVTAKLISMDTSTNTFQVAVSHFDGTTLTQYLSTNVTLGWSEVYDYPAIKLKVIRIGSYVGVYANNALLNFGQNSLLGETVTIPSFLNSGLFVLDGFIPYTDTFGLYINGVGGGYPTYDTIIFNNMQIFDLARDVTLDYFMKDASTIGGIMEYNGQILFNDTFASLTNWQ